jgi:hypothetical protein
MIPRGGTIDTHSGPTKLQLTIARLFGKLAGFEGGLRNRSVIARQPSFSTARLRSRIGVSKWDSSDGTQLRQKEQKEDLNSSCQSIHSR